MGLGGRSVANIFPPPRKNQFRRFPVFSPFTVRIFRSKNRVLFNRIVTSSSDGTGKRRHTNPSNNKSAGFNVSASRVRRSMLQSTFSCNRKRKFRGTAVRKATTKLHVMNSARNPAHRCSGTPACNFHTRARARVLMRGEPHARECVQIRRDASAFTVYVTHSAHAHVRAYTRISRAEVIASPAVARFHKPRS